MSVVAAAGREWVVALDWEPRLRGAALTRRAEDLDRPWVVHAGAQTGLVGADQLDPDGLPSLAAALLAHLGAAEPWTALLAADDGRVATVRASDGAIVADELHAGPDAALAALPEDAGPLRASAGLAVEGAEPLDVAEIEIAAAMCVAPARARAGASRMVRTASAVAALALLGALGWFERATIEEWIFGPPEPVAVAEKEREVTVAIAGAALVAACADALRAWPVGLAGWQLSAVSCTAGLTDQAILALEPRLRDRPALVVGWKLPGRSDAAIHRRLAEEHLSRWPLAAVTGRSAQAAVPLDPVLTQWDATLPPPDFRTVRAALDRAAGPWAVKLAWGRERKGVVTVNLEGPAPLSRAHAALAAVEGIEVLTVRLRGARNWTIAARLVRPRTMLESAWDAHRSPLVAG